MSDWINVSGSDGSMSTQQVIPADQNPYSSQFNPSNVVHSPEKDLSKYSSWNGDWKGYLSWLADNGDKDALDRLMNYAMSEDSAKTERDWDSHSYSRMFEDMRNAGVNPYAMFTMGASPISSSSNTHYSGNYSSSYELNKTKEKQNWLKIALQGALPVIGALIAAML